MNCDLQLLKVGHCCHPEAMVTGGHRWKSIEFPAIVGLIRHPHKGYILFDTGYAKHFTHATQPFPQRFYRWLTPMHLCDKQQLSEQLLAQGISPSDIAYVFISHFHADHISGLLDFPKAKYICSKIGLEDFKDRKNIAGLIKGYLKELLPGDFYSRVEFIEDYPDYSGDSEFAPFSNIKNLSDDGSLLAVSVPGHASGHYGLICKHDDRQTFLVGDACWTSDAFTHGVRPLPLANLIMSSPQEYTNTLEKLTALHRNNPSLSIVPSHCAAAFEKWIQENNHHG